MNRPFIRIALPSTANTAIVRHKLCDCSCEFKWIFEQWSDQPTKRSRYYNPGKTDWSQQLLLLLWFIIFDQMAFNILHWQFEVWSSINIGYLSPNILGRSLLAANHSYGRHYFELGRISDTNFCLILYWPIEFQTWIMNFAVWMVRSNIEGPAITWHRFTHINILF